MIDDTRVKFPKFARVRKTLKLISSRCRTWQGWPYHWPGWMDLFPLMHRLDTCDIWSL